MQFIGPDARNESSVCMQWRFPLRLVETNQNPQMDSIFLHSTSELSLVSKRVLGHLQHLHPINRQMKQHPPIETRASNNNNNNNNNNNSSSSNCTEWRKISLGKQRGGEGGRKRRRKRRKRRRSEKVPGLFAGWSRLPVGTICQSTAEL